jgi:hypothetical protein
MPEDIAIAVSNISKRYFVYESQRVVRLGIVDYV